MYIIGCSVSLRSIMTPNSRSLFFSPLSSLLFFRPSHLQFYKIVRLSSSIASSSIPPPSHAFFSLQSLFHLYSLMNLQLICQELRALLRS